MELKYPLKIYFVFFFLFDAKALIHCSVSKYVGLIFSLMVFWLENLG